MKYRKGVFIVVYYLEKETPYYLILKRKLHWTGWEFPKGGIDEKEKIIDSVKREVQEETGLKFTEIKKFKFSGKYDYKEKLKDRKDFQGQTFESLYAVKAKSKNAVIDNFEHSEFKWLEFSDAVKLLTWPNQKTALKIVHSDLISNKKEFSGFRKEITSSGKLILAGKTQENNEKLIKTQVHKEEIVFHTVARGSPFVVLKNSHKEKPTQQDIKETAIFCAKHSHDWRDNKKNVLVHYFKGKDIYKLPSMKTGTFGVKGSKEILVRKGELK